MATRYLVQCGSRYLEINPARTQQAGTPQWDTTGSVKYATTFVSRAVAAEAAAQARMQMPGNPSDYPPIEIVEDWRAPGREDREGEVMATNREKILARKLLAMQHEHKAQATDPDKWNREFEELALKLARLCVGTRP